MRGVNALRRSGRLIVICRGGGGRGRHLLKWAAGSATRAAGLQQGTRLPKTCPHLGDALCLVVLDLQQLVPLHRGDAPPGRRRPRHLPVHLGVGAGLACGRGVRAACSGPSSRVGAPACTRAASRRVRLQLAAAGPGRMWLTAHNVLRQASDTALCHRVHASPGSDAQLKSAERRPVLPFILKACLPCLLSPPPPFEPRLQAHEIQRNTCPEDKGVSGGTLQGAVCCDAVCCDAIRCDAIRCDAVQLPRGAALLGGGLCCCCCCWRRRRRRRVQQGAPQDVVGVVDQHRDVPLAGQEVELAAADGVPVPLAVHRRHADVLLAVPDGGPAEGREQGRGLLSQSRQQRAVCEVPARAPSPPAARAGP